MTYFFEVQLRKANDQTVLVGIVVRETAHGDVTGFTQHATAIDIPLSQAISRAVSNLGPMPFQMAASRGFCP